LSAERGRQALLDLMRENKMSEQNIEVKSFGDEHYVPVLKWKRGEARALKELAPTVKAACTPLIEVVPIPFDYDAGVDKKSLRKHIDDAVEELATSWGTKAPVFVDVVTLLPAGVGTGNTLTMMFDEMRKAGVRAIPVVSTASPTDVIAAGANAHKKDGRGVFLRERIDDVIAPKYPARVAATLLSLGVSASRVDFMLDMQDVAENKQATNATAVTSAINKIPNLKSWRTFTLCSTAFPINLSGMAQGVNTIPRADWALWNALGKLPRTPTFGDYAVAHWDLQALDPRVIKISASIRYTTDDAWVICRGRNVNQHGFGQFSSLSKLLVKHSAYCGGTFSAGDDYIAKCAAGGKPGNHETWRRVATNHHITFVVKQIASTALAASTPAGHGPAAGSP
jgi:hypothetical protein